MTVALDLSTFLALVTAIALIAACTPRAPDAPPVAPPASPMAQGAAAPASDAAVPMLRRQLATLSAQEPAAVLSPRATPDAIAEITAADRAARTALQPLERKRHTITAAELATAHAAVQRLQAAVAAVER